MQQAEPVLPQRRSAMSVLSRELPPAPAPAAVIARRVAAPPQPAVAAADSFGALWWTRIPGRVAAAVTFAVLPLRVVAWLLDAAVSAAAVSAMAVGWAWWTQRITDDQVAQVLGQIGQRGLGILNKAGIF